MVAESTELRVLNIESIRNAKGIERTIAIIIIRIILLAIFM